MDVLWNFLVVEELVHHLLQSSGMVCNCCQMVSVVRDEETILIFTEVNFGGLNAACNPLRVGRQLSDRLLLPRKYEQTHILQLGNSFSNRADVVLGSIQKE